MEQSAFLLALIVSFLGAVPLLISKEYQHAGVLGVVSLFLLTPFYYFVVPSLVWPFWGLVGGTLFILWVLCAFTENDLASRRWDRNKNNSATWIFPVAFVVIYFVSAFFRGSTILHSQEYSDMLGKVETRVWTEDVQPKNPKHMRAAILIST